MLQAREPSIQFDRVAGEFFQPHPVAVTEVQPRRQFRHPLEESRQVRGPEVRVDVTLGVRRHGAGDGAYVRDGVEAVPGVPVRVEGGGDEQTRTAAVPEAEDRPPDGHRLDAPRERPRRPLALAQTVQTPQEIAQPQQPTERQDRDVQFPGQPGHAAGDLPLAETAYYEPLARLRL